MSATSIAAVRCQCVLHVLCLTVALSLAGCGGSGSTGPGGNTGPGTGPGGPQGPTPILSSVEPTQAATGQAITLMGDHFEVDARLNNVFFDAQQATVTQATSRELTVLVPPGLAAGQVQLTVATRFGSSQPAGFTVVAGPAQGPSLTRIDPPVGHVGRRVTLHGSGFSTGLFGNTVSFGGTSAVVVSAQSTAITVDVPFGARSGPVTVRTGGDSSNPIGFYVTSESTTLTSILDPQGARAGDYLSGSTYTHLVLEIDCTPNDAPSAETLNLLAERMSERLNKPGGIRFILDDEIPDRAVWTVDDIRDAEDQHRDHYHVGNTAVYYILYLGGHRDTDSNTSRTLGVSYSATSMAIFRETSAASATGQIPAPEVEAAVSVHELGHNLGLVNNGTPMVHNHEDANHRGHDASKGCVMYWEIGIHDQARLSQNGGRLHTQFDAECIADIQANGGR